MTQACDTSVFEEKVKRLFQFKIDDSGITPFAWALQYSSSAALFAWMHSSHRSRDVLNVLGGGVPKHRVV